MLVSLLAVLITGPGAMSGLPRPCAVPSPAAVPRRIGDAEIIGTLGTVDANVIEAAKLAASKAKSQEVRDYAKLLIRDHERSQQMLLRLAKQLHLAPVLPSDSSFTRAHKQEMDQLNLISAADLDKAFVQSMVADHKTIINKIDTVLLAGATRRSLKAFIRRLRPTLVMHEAKGQAWLDKQQG